MSLELTQERLERIGILESDSKVLKLFSKVKKQASAHMRRVSSIPSLNERRPGEDDKIKEYRVKNHRMITKDGIDNWIATACDIFKNLNVRTEGISDALKEELQVPFSIKNRNYSFKDFYYEYILKYAINDPNAVLVEHPYRSSEPNIPPRDVREEANSRVERKTWIIPSELIAVLQEDLFGFYGGTIELKKEEYKKIANWYWIIDLENWYRYIPRLEKDEKGKYYIVYDLELWYFHDTGYEDIRVLPVLHLPSNISLSEDGFAYGESLLHPFLEHGDEFINRFSDEQAVNKQFCYPIKIYKASDCVDCNGTGQKWHVENGVRDSSFCASCNGSGKNAIFSPYKAIKKPEAKGLDDKADEKMVEIISPQPEILNYAYEKTFDILQRGYNSIGLLLFDNGQESGVAREYRFKRQQNIMNKLAGQLFAMQELHLLMIESLLEYKRNRRKVAKLVPPDVIQVKDIATLEEEAKESAPILRYSRNLELIQKKYNTNEVEKRKHLIAMKFAPCIIYTMDELMKGKASGIYDDVDVKKYKLVMPLLNDIDIEEMEDDEVLAELEAKFNEVYTPSDIIPLIE